MTNVNVKSTESSRRLLRYSRRCALIPGALGVSAVLGWLAVGGLMDDVAPFYFLGILAIGLGLLLLPVSLQAGESRTWVLHYSSEGSATFRAQQGARIIEHEGGIFLGIGQPMEVLLEFEDNGQYKLEGVSARRWFWFEALRN